MQSEPCLYVTINDFQTRFVPDRSDESRYEIQIIHDADTMFLNQSSYPLPVRRLQFIPGHYYFPRWGSSVLEYLPITSGDVHLMNIDQRNFIVPKELFNIDAYAREDLQKRDELIARRFIDPFYTVDIKTESTQADKSFAPYEAEGFNSLYETAEDGIFIGKVGYHLQESYTYFGNNVIAVFNKPENSISYKAPDDNMKFFFCSTLYADTFNRFYYQTIGKREPYSDGECDHLNDGKCAFERQVLRSTDEGNTWNADKELTKLFNRFDHFDLNFVDRNYAVASVRIEGFAKSHTRTHQAAYYLFRNGKLVDSLKSPVYSHYEDDFQHHFIQLAPDSIVLGIWHTSNYNPEKFKANSPMLIQIGDKWKFQVTDYKQHHATWNNRKEIVRTYTNLTVKDEHILELDSGSLDLHFNKVISTLYDQGTYIFEKGSEIYLLDKASHCTWFSLDKGKSWYFYPKELDEFRSPYDTVEAENDLLTVFNSSELKKVFYQFTPIEK